MASLAAFSPWSDLPPELLGCVIAHLPFPADRARFRVVCRAWHSAARQHIRQLPWVVLPDASFCTIGDDGVFFENQIPGMPENATCIGSADGWLALDCTDDVLRRTSLLDKLCSDTFIEPRNDVKHRHTYLLHNPFSNTTVPLPELDAIIGHVPETFEVRKVLMRSSGPDDIVAVTTNNWNYPIIMCRPGKGTCVMPDLRVFDVAFLGDTLYGITPTEDLIAFDLAKDKDGGPIVTKYKRVIRHPLADGEEDLWSWLDDDNTNGNGDNTDDDDDDDGELSSTNDNNSDVDDYDHHGELPISSDDEDEESESQDEEDIFSGDGMMPRGRQVVAEDEDWPYEPKDCIKITHHLVESSGRRELLMVKHHVQIPPFSNAYTSKVELFKADVNAGKWVPVTHDALPKDEALFISQSFCKSTSVYGDIRDGFVYSTDVDDVFDTRSWARRTFNVPWQRNLASTDLLTWLFPAGAGGLISS